MERVGKQLAKAALSRDLFRGVGLTNMRNYCYDKLHEKVFAPHQILREMDLSSGSLNYTAIKILRKVENLSGKKWFRGIIVESSPLPQHSAKIFTPQGEGVEFVNKGTVIELIHKAFVLTKIGQQRALEVAITTDGSLLVHLINLGMVGYKLIDPPAARHPITKELMLDPTNPLYVYQSHDLCFSLLMMLGKETNDMFSLNIKPVYDECFASSKVGATNLMVPGSKPFVCCCPGDLSCHWKLTKIGHGAKACTCFCMNCALTSKNISSPAEIMCQESKEKKGPETDFGKKWKEDHGQDWQCYHHEFADNEFIDKCQASMDELIAEHQVELANLEK
eukprot:scaffold203374_cov56-Attheya_sp.AAC.2